MTQLKNKKIILGVTGGISAYKAVEFARLLMKEEAEVQVIMTRNATQFIAPLTFEAITRKSVLLDLFESTTEIQHIDHAQSADLIIIMPATASFIAHIANGFADDLLSAVCLASKTSIVLVPAMNKQMWSNLATQHNVSLLKKRKVIVLDTAFGEQACGDIGYGRMLELETVFNQILSMFFMPLLKDKKVLLTVGATREPIDAVRYISNSSSGKMGFNLAEVLRRLGAQVTLVCGHYEASPPNGCELIKVSTAQEMYDKVMERVRNCNIFIGVAAVADYRSKEIVEKKIKSNNELINLTLIKNPDILSDVASLKNKPFTVGFALESENLVENAKKKLQTKKLDMIIANACSPESPLGSDDNEAYILNSQGKVVYLKKASKYEIACNIANSICKALKSG